MLPDQGAKFVVRDAAGLRHAWNLEFSGGRADIRIEAGTRSRNQVNRDGLAGIFGLQGCNVSLHAINQLLIRRPVVRSAGAGSVISVTSRRGASVKIGNAG